MKKDRLLTCPWDLQSPKREGRREERRMRTKGMKMGRLQLIPSHRSPGAWTQRALSLSHPLLSSFGKYSWVWDRLHARCWGRTVILLHPLAKSMSLSSSCPPTQFLVIPQTFLHPPPGPWAWWVPSQFCHLLRWKQGKLPGRSIPTRLCTPVHTHTAHAHSPPPTPAKHT